MQVDTDRDLYKQLGRWPKVDFSALDFFGKLETTFDFGLKYLGERLNHEGLDCVVLKVEDQKPYRDLRSQSLLELNIWCWATPTWSVIECHIPIADGVGTLRSIYSPYDPLMTKLLNGEDVGLAVASSSGEYFVCRRNFDGLVNARGDDLDSLVLRSFQNWTARDTEPVFQRLPIEVAFFDYLLHRRDHKKNPEAISQSAILSMSWAFCYKHSWETFFRALAQAREMLKANHSLHRFLIYLRSEEGKLFPEFLGFSEILESDAEAFTIIELYQKEAHQAFVLAMGVGQNLCRGASGDDPIEAEFRRSLIELLQLLFKLSYLSPKGTNAGRRRFLWRSGCSISNQEQIVLEIDTDYIGQHSATYWADIIESEIFLGEILTEKDVPIPRIRASKWIQEIKCDLSVDQIVECAKANVGEIRFAKKWTIPWGARVDVRFGNFRYLEVYDMGGEFITLFRDVNDHYLYLAFQPDEDVPWATAPLAFFDREGSPENYLGQALLFLVASSAIRDFCVVEERESVFSSKIERVSKLRKYSSSDNEQVIFIPRVRYRRLIEHTSLNSNSAEGSQHSRAFHEVKAHLRKAEKASIHQIVLASRYGMSIPKGYTFVRPHQRGGYEEEFMERKRIYRSRSVSTMLFERAEDRSGAARIPEWFKFERDTEKIFEGFGWEVLERKPNKGRGDGGVDVLAFDPKEEILWVAQCKCYTNRVVQPEKIRELIGTVAIQQEAVRCKGMFLTTSIFSVGAVELAIKEGIELVDGQRFLQLLEKFNVCSQS